MNMKKRNHCDTLVKVESSFESSFLYATLSSQAMVAKRQLEELVHREGWPLMEVFCWGGKMCELFENVDFTSLLSHTHTPFWIAVSLVVLVFGVADEGFITDIAHLLSANTMTSMRRKLMAINRLLLALFYVNRFRLKAPVWTLDHYKRWTISSIYDVKHLKQIRKFVCFYNHCPFYTIIDWGR